MTDTAAEYHRGDMDVHEQKSTFHSVMIATKWATLAIIVAVAFLTLWFCTGAGFFSALVTGVVLTVLGVVFLRERGTHH